MPLHCRTELKLGLAAMNHSDAGGKQVGSWCKRLDSDASAGEAAMLAG